jgi:hypothetical protein
LADALNRRQKFCQLCQQKGGTLDSDENDDDEWRIRRYCHFFPVQSGAGFRLAGRERRLFREFCFCCCCCCCCRSLFCGDIGGAANIPAVAYFSRKVGDCRLLAAVPITALISTFHFRTFDLKSQPPGIKVFPIGEAV